jgi:hypothetical protein
MYGGKVQRYAAKELRKSNLAKESCAIDFSLSLPNSSLHCPLSVISPPLVSSPPSHAHDMHHLSTTSWVFLPPHLSYLIGGVAIGQIAQGEAGPICHTCVALMRIERLDQPGESPSITKGVLQPHKTHKKRETHMTRTKHNNMCDGKKKTSRRRPLVVPIKEKTEKHENKGNG